ncbi:hypothetical protein EV189_1679 [Motilibacter rhizosphaerae]|uniref:Uncharacterized protein n=2 Tax=Motilibacter rhizosphaerae TaxID=598652 RepID=A0A4Q7NSR2_9ACTN|nr:hypothetical protein EV189_1679 [Motilibacter rhizosphaerae]
MGWRRGTPLSERTVPPPSRTGDTPQHCWVQDPEGHPGRWPAVLLAWGRGPDGGWRGRVAYAARTSAGDVVLVECWATALALAPLAPPRLG